MRFFFVFSIAVLCRRHKQADLGICLCSWYFVYAWVPCINSCINEIPGWDCPRHRCWHAGTLAADHNNAMLFLSSRMRSMSWCPCNLPYANLACFASSRMCSQCHDVPAICHLLISHALLCSCALCFRPEYTCDHRMRRRKEPPCPFPWVMSNPCKTCSILCQYGTDDTSKCAVRHTILTFC
jgi:hypothetical protein